jgi:hypothetical protein
MPVIRVRILIALLLGCVTSSFGQTSAAPQLAPQDRVRLAELFRLGAELQDTVWEGWRQAPFAVLLVTPENEFLVRHPQPSEDFTLLGDDALLKSGVYYRKRTFSPDLLATFPAVGGISTIVVGPAEMTQAKTSTPWVLTLMHEHFHQWQDSQPGFYAEVNALGLARGDQSGMWMLNYPFPYEDAKVNERHAAMAAALVAAIETRGTPQFEERLRAYRKARAELKQALAPDDYKYLAFQLWKEGVARYTEYAVARAAAERFRPSAEFAALGDFTPFAQEAEAALQRVLRELRTLTLARNKRVCFYALGAGEALLLDEVNSAWKDRYLKEKFDLEEYFPK